MAVLLPDLVVGGSLLRPPMTYDYVKHIMVTNSLSLSGVPPVNPSFYPGEPLSLFYYYFWFIPISLVDQLGSVWITPREAVLGGVFWAPMGLVATVWLFIRHFGVYVVPDVRKSFYPCLLLLLGLAGLDIIPVLMMYVLKAALHLPQDQYPSIDWWNELPSNLVNLSNIEKFRKDLYIFYQLFYIEIYPT